MYREAVCENQLHTKQSIRSRRELSVLSGGQIYVSICQQGFLQVVNIRTLQIKKREGAKTFKVPNRNKFNAKLFVEI